MAYARRLSSDSIVESIPLDKLQIDVCSKNGVETKVSGIHIGFMEARYYIPFRMPPIFSNNDIKIPEEEEWFECMTFLEQDLHWVLKLPHHGFWSQIVYDEDLHRCLESYLSQAPRAYDLTNLNLKKDICDAIKRVHRLVLLVYLRMSTYKESKQHHITPSAFGEIIYDNFIFDVPKLMDLCALYGIQNPALLSKMMQNIFSTQPKYFDDLNESAKITLTAFNSVEEKLVDISSRKSDSKNSDELLQYVDVTKYVTDISMTLFSFLDSYPPACEVFHQNGAILRLPTFYEQVFSVLEKEIWRLSKSFENNLAFESMKQRISLSKTTLIKIFRNILNYAYIQNILTAKSSGQDDVTTLNLLAEGFLEVMLELISYKSFLSDYNLLYPFDGDLELFNEIEINLDSEKVNQIFCSMINDEDEAASSSTFTSTVSNGARPKVVKPESSHKPVKNFQGLADMLKSTNGLEQIPDPPVKTKPTLDELNSLIQLVLDILPNYGEGYIQKCLENYEYCSEEVINALLTDSLPLHLKNLDTNLKEVDWEAVSNEHESVLSERKNVFDNDEFDMFSGRDVNMKNVHLGKKNKIPETYESLQNDKDSEYLKKYALNYDSDEKESRVNIYEDEYDDTYDSVMFGLKEPEDDPDDEEDDEPKVKKDLRDKQDDFCINPALLRERAEQRRQSQFNQGRHNKGSAPSNDHDRQNKDRRKAQVGNHNRRKQSDFKRSRGMGAL